MHPQIRDGSYRARRDRSQEGLEACGGARPRHRRRGRPASRAWLAAALATVWLGSGACSTAPKPAARKGTASAAQTSSAAQTPSAAQTSSAAAATESAGGCAGLTPEQASSILNVPPTDVEGPKSYGEFSCVYRSRSHPYTGITFNVYVESSPAVAIRKMEADEEGLAFLSSIDTLSGLGDEAWLAPDSRAHRLVLRKGATWVDIVAPGDSASQMRIARIVLAHL